MNIGDVSDLSGLPTKTIRYYEDIGLVHPARGANGYRDFNEREAHRLTFLARARSLGFSIEECRTLLSLYADRSRASAEVKDLARDHLDRIAQKIRELDALRRTLETLVSQCHGDDRPDCPILDDLSGTLGKPT
ncbi:transcriptional regulator [Jannaschia faecimaris]|uniref:Transcriptional regulator n=1 Tax=Jannaschia faecimaris TaxID=1244108 RepID=A0A1H3S967_9RHOB|nr:Cu(I)-responsive transcriptional regulator [Jannaschia faecimaris]SDZ34586.1 transcriptional regulator [Jannaschia faecimaris]